MITVNPHAERRLHSANNIWVATVRPDGRPHLTPVWFVWQAGKAYICIDPGSVKARNLAHNERMVFALEDGSSPVIIEGVGRALDGSELPEGVVDAFRRKYDWNIAADSQYSLLVEITPGKVLIWNSGGQISGRI